MNTRQFFSSAIIAIILLVSCDSEDPVVLRSFPVAFTFSQLANNQALEINDLKYQNAIGNTFSVEKLQYIVSDIVLHKTDGSTIMIDDYHFVDISDPLTLTFDPGIVIEEGDYQGISMVFGLKEDKNITGAYAELNALSWSWPEMLGGGYHFMKLEGRYIDSNTNVATFATHMGTAREITATDTLFHANYIEVDLANNAFTIDGQVNIDIEMEVSNWYSDPFMWDLNLLDNVIMPNFDAQLKLRDNGHNVFSIGSVTTE